MSSMYNNKKKIETLFLPGLKLSDPGGGGGDLHGLLTSSHHHLKHKPTQTQVSEVGAEKHSDRVLRGLYTWSLYLRDP